MADFPDRQQGAQQHHETGTPKATGAEARQEEAESKGQAAEQAEGKREKAGKVMADFSDGQEGTQRPQGTAPTEKKQEETGGVMANFPNQQEREPQHRKAGPAPRGQEGAQGHSEATPTQEVAKKRTGHEAAQGQAGQQWAAPQPRGPRAESQREILNKLRAKYRPWMARGRIQKTKHRGAAPRQGNTVTGTAGAKQEAGEGARVKPQPRSRQAVVQAVEGMWRAGGIHLLKSGYRQVA